MTVPDTPNGADAAAPDAPKWNEGMLTALSVVALATLVLSFAGLMRAGHSATKFGGILPKDLAAAGATVYGATANCASCHGARGGGGVGPAMAGGAVVKTFPNPVDQVRWVIGGSDGAKALYEKAGKTSKGGMPAWGTKLSLEQIVDVVLYERQEVSGAKLTADEVSAWADLKNLPKEFPDLKYTDADVQALLDKIAAAQSK